LEPTIGVAHDFDDVSNDHGLRIESENCSSYRDFSGGSDFVGGPSVANIASLNDGGGADDSLPYFDRHLWRHRYYELFN